MLMNNNIIMYISKDGKGLNLTVQVLDAIMCHNGEFVKGKYCPKPKTKEEFLQEYQSTYKDKDAVKHLVPMTLEGCVVRISDVIAYLGRDIDDACMLKLFTKKDIPKEIVEVLGYHNREIINTIILDIINNSLNKPYIKLSDSVYKAIVALKKFNYEKIYNQALDENSKKKIESMFEINYDAFLNDVKTNNINSKIYQNFLNYKNNDYLKNTTDARKVIDFIAGMTDDYFVNCYNENKLKHNK